MPRFQIGFYGDQNINHPRFLAGDTIKGYLDVHFPHATKVKGIYFTFYGRCLVKWWTGPVSKKRHHTAYEVYVEEKLVLFGIPPHAKGHSEDHPAGTFRYDFEAKVPDDAPPTITLSKGDIKYSLKFRVQSEDTFDDNSHKKEIYITNKTDLSQLKNIDAPMELNKQKYICCLCCRSGPISGFCRIDKSGYLPGDTITVSAEATNLSNRTCNSTSIRLVQEILYKADDAAKERERDILCTVEHGKLEPGETDSYHNIQFEIPPHVMTSMKACKIMRLKHSVKLVVCPQKSLDLDVPLDITIGTPPQRADRLRALMVNRDENVGTSAGGQPFSLDV